MRGINDTPALATASVGIAQAVDKPWFIAVVLVLTTIIGACLGSIKQRYRTVRFVTDVRPVYAEDTAAVREGR